MGNNKFKIIVFILISLVILTAIACFLGGKLEQQDRIHMRNELSIKDSKLRELGVNYCVIQPREVNSNRLFVMIDFWETNKAEIKKRLEKIKVIVTEYCKMEEIDSPVITYIDSNGFNMEDVLGAQADVGFNESEAEYHSVVQRFIGDMEQRLVDVLGKVIPVRHFRMMMIADAEYDVTLDTYGAKKLYFFARFRNADTAQLQAMRIAYKRISGFKVSRGDKIYFYNQSVTDFELVNIMQRIIEKQKNKVIKDRVVVFAPYDFVGPLESANSVPERPLITPITVNPLPSSSPSPESSQTASPVPVESSTPEPPLHSPDPSSTPEISPSPFGPAGSNKLFFRETAL